MGVAKVSPLFEVWYPDPSVGGQWRWAGTGQDRAGAVQIIGYFRAYTGLPEESFCMACYDGRYPVAYDPSVDKHIIERRNGRVPSIADTLAAEKAQIRLL